MRRSRSAAAVRGCFEPNQKLIQAEAARFDLPTEKLTAVLAVFGPLPEDGQRQLLHRLYSAFVPYWFGRKTERVITSGATRDRLRTIEASARKLLNYLGVNYKIVAPPWCWENALDRTPWEKLSILGKPDAKGSAILMRLASADNDYRNVDVDRVNAELAVASKRTAEVVTSLLWLRSQAQLAAQRVQPQKGRGGVRNRPTPQGALLRDCIFIYAHMRDQYPQSGRKPGYGGPMLRFVRAVAALADESVTDNAIKEVWNSIRKKI